VNYSVNDLRGRNMHTTKATLQRTGVTLDLVVKPGEQPTPDMVNYADSVSHVDESGEVVAKTKSLDGKTFDNRHAAPAAE
jgi:hypothetical protein